MSREQPTTAKERKQLARDIKRQRKQEEQKENAYQASLTEHDRKMDRWLDLRDLFYHDVPCNPIDHLTGTESEYKALHIDLYGLESYTLFMADVKGNN